MTMGVVFADALIELRSLSSVLGVLTALIAPALLISASGTLITSTVQRLMSNTERFRLLAQKLSGMREERSALRLDARRSGRSATPVQHDSA
jgi:hypothetical protein